VMHSLAHLLGLAKGPDHHRHDDQGHSHGEAH
jgi:hypothetical protein